jgi:glycogen synthase
MHDRIKSFAGETMAVIVRQIPNRLELAIGGVAGESLEELLRHCRKNGMKADFSWNRTVGEYLKIYEAAKKVSG